MDPRRVRGLAGPGSDCGHDLADRLWWGGLAWHLAHGWVPAQLLHECRDASPCCACACSSLPGLRLQILNKYVGASEENIRNLFKEAEADYAKMGEASGARRSRAAPPAKPPSLVGYGPETSCPGSSLPCAENLLSTLARGASLRPCASV